MGSPQKQDDPDQRANADRGLGDDLPGGITVTQTYDLVSNDLRPLDPCGQFASGSVRIVNGVGALPSDREWFVCHDLRLDSGLAELPEMDESWRVELAARQVHPRWPSGGFRLVPTAELSGDRR